LACFLSVLERSLECGFGWVALAVHQGKARGVVWRSEQRSERHQSLPTVERRRFRCDDAQPAADPLILDGVQDGALEVPRDASVRRSGEEIHADDRGERLASKARRWLGEAGTWSLVPGATAAFVCSARDHWVVWMGVHVGSVPRPWIDVPRPPRRRPTALTAKRDTVSRAIASKQVE
jgi:hypothetical protein